MNVALWIVQAFLAFVFLMAGGMKLRSKEQVLGQMPVLARFSESQIRAIAVVEVLGAIGLILPAATGILPVLTPLAAGGLVLDMAVAAFVHYRNDERHYMIVNAMLLALAAFAAYGRFFLEPL